MQDKIYTLSGALLYFDKGARKRLAFTAKTTDLERLREVIKTKHNAKVVRFEYEEAI